MKPALVALAVLVLFVSCKTTPTEIPDDLSQAELVQRAQEASDSENWETSLAYYQAVLDRFPQDRAATVAAHYEMAFIEYKRGDTAAAIAGFEQMLGFYDFEVSALPQWPRVLGEKLLTKILAENAAETATAEE